MTKLARTLLLIGLAMPLLSACAGRGIPPFQPIDLSGDLNPSVLARYQTAADKAFAADSSRHMIPIEKTDWRLLGLLAFWNKGEVLAMHGAEGKFAFMVSQTHGYGPLALLFSREKQAMFSTEGQLTARMGIDSAIWGHLAMRHSMGWKDGALGWQEHSTLHLIHHLFSIGEMHGRTALSLFSAPNPASFGG